MNVDTTKLTCAYKLNSGRVANNKQDCRSNIFHSEFWKDNWNIYFRFRIQTKLETQR